MTEQQWQSFANKIMTVPGDRKLKLHLGKFLGDGGSGAVYELVRSSGEWVIKLLDPDSPIAIQEHKGIDIISANSRFAIGIQKQIPSRGIVQFGNQQFSCYIMRKGKSLKQAIDEEEWLTLRDKKRILQMMAHLVNGICSLKNMGVCHGDIKLENILLFEYNNDFYPTLADYGTVSNKKLSIETIHYSCDKNEYGSSLEEGIAYDLHCLYLVFCEIYKIDANDDKNISSIPNPDIKRLLRIMRDAGTKAFVRLNQLMTALKDMIKIPPGFYLDSIMEEDLKRCDDQFGKFMQWKEYYILRDKSAINDFDPLVLLPVSAERYDNAYHIICMLDQMDLFVMPIVRYYDKEGNQYVLLHAPDDKNIASKRGYWREDEYCKLRIKDESGIPYTLGSASISAREKEMEKFINKLSRHKINIEISPDDIWHVDGEWKLNLFSVKFLELAEKDAEICRISWGKA